MDTKNGIHFKGMEIRAEDRVTALTAMLLL